MNNLKYEEEEVVEEELGGSVPPPPESGGGGDDAGWLTSYADLMTLVACFFILMMAFANYDPATFQRKAELMAKYFHGENSDAEEPMAKLMDELNKVSNKLEIKHNDDGLDITMNVKTLFNLGSADLTEGSQILVDRIIEKILEIHKDVRVVIEGHTDNLPIYGSKIYPSNWELSGARASSVVRRFEARGFPRHELVALGFADTRPAVPNVDKDGNSIPENQLQNRRIVLKVLHPTKANVPLGLGVLFKGNSGPTEPSK